MNIAVVYHGIYPENRGIHQLCSSLVALGHKTCVFAHHGNKENVFPIISGIQIYYLSNSPRQINSLKQLPQPINPYWCQFLLKNFLQLKIDALILRESLLAWQALYVCRKLGIPVYLDMRENLAAMYNSFGKGKLWNSPFKHRAIVHAYEAKTLPHFHGIFTVSEELKKWLLITYRNLPKKIEVLGNFPSSDFVACTEFALKNKERQEDHIRLAFAGYVEKNRGLGEVIQSLSAVVKEFPNLKLIIIGEGKDIPRLKCLTRKMDMLDKVEFKSMLSQPELATTLVNCNVGLAPYWINEQSNQTVPGKIFEYMAAELPILSSPRKPVIRILNETGCGLTYDSQKPQDIAAGIIKILSDPKEMAAMGRRGREAIHNRYNWRSGLLTLDSLLSS